MIAKHTEAPYAAARRKVFRQLLEALIFEGVVMPEVSEGTEWQHYRLQGKDEKGSPVAYAFLGRRRFTFGFVRLKEDEPVYRCTGARREEALSVSLLLHEVLGDQLAEHGRRPQLLSFSHELEETLAKDAASRFHRVADEAGRIRLLKARQSRIGIGYTYEELELLSSGGHPYHPCYKSRIGFSLKDHLTYGPEFGPSLQVVWAAAAASDVLCSAGTAKWREQITEQLGDHVIERFDNTLLEQGLQPELYCYLPMHPWQWSRKAADFGQRTGRSVVLLGNGPDEYRPQQSIRTLSNRTDPRKSDLKLSLHITNTSSLRNLSIHSVAAAPSVSRWLQAIVDSDPYLKGEAQLVLLHEYAGASYLPAEGGASCIWRESIYQYLEAGEEAAPFHALLACDSNGVPFIAPWVEACGGIECWLRSFIRNCCLPAIHLLVAHGIVLESHAQNMVLIHRNGLPVRVALKDFHEGVEYYEPFLAAPELVPDFAAIHPVYAAGNVGDHFAMGSLNDLTEMLVDALLFMNVGYLAMLVADKLDYAERSFWRLFVQELDMYRAAFPMLSGRFDALQLFTPTCSIERLASKRLYQSKLGQGAQPAPNPLHWARMERQGIAVSEQKAAAYREGARV